MSDPGRSVLREFLWRSAFAFALLYILTLSFDWTVFPDPMHLWGSPFQRLAAFTGSLFFGVTLTGDHEFYSDSLLVYVHQFNLVLISVITSSIWTWRSEKQFRTTKALPFLLSAIRYFLALMLLVYGFSKIFKWQFYLPEPNTLYQTVGNTPRDLLYWTSMGTSYTYSMFMGVIEIIPALLLLFRRTTVAGALIALLVMINVLFVNLGFDITVKLHSFVLILFCVLLLVPARQRILGLFTGKSTAEWSYPVFSFQPDRKWITVAAKWIVIVLLLSEAGYRYAEAGNFNGDQAEHIPMHGAYQVLTYCSPYGDTLVARSQPSRHLFIHGKGYMIFMYENGQVKDYSIAVDTVSHAIISTGSVFDGSFEDLKWTKLNDSIYEFRPTEVYSPEYWKVKKLDLTKLPLLQEEFSWIDEQ